MEHNIELYKTCDKLLEIALQFKVLIHKKRKPNVIHEKERTLIKKKARDIRIKEASIVNNSYQETLQHINEEYDIRTTNQLDVLDIEDKLSRHVETLKEILFDQTIDYQQIILISDRLRLSNISKLEAAREYDSSRHSKTFQDLPVIAGFVERDALVTKVLENFRKIEDLKSQDLQIQRDLRKAQISARDVWRRTRPDNENNGLSKGDRLGENYNTIVRHNNWLKHCLTDLLLESKIAWVNDPVLRQLVLYSDGSQ